MPSTSDAHIIVVTVRGAFCIRSADGDDVTPKSRKERAIIGILALMDGRRCSRRRIESLLWSDSTPEKASQNSRRAFSNLVKKFEAHAAIDSEILGSDRNEIWLEPGVHIDMRPDLEGQAQLLELIDAPDDAFDEWLAVCRERDEKDIAARRVTPTPTKGTSTANVGTVIVIAPVTPQASDTGLFFESIFIDILSARFQAEGADDIYINDVPDKDIFERAAAIIHVEIRSLVEHRNWSVSVRVLADQNRRFLWSDKYTASVDVDLTHHDSDVQAFVSKAMTMIQLRYQSFRHTNLSPLMLMQRAATRLYDPSIERVRLGEQDLLKITSGEGAAIALAWRSFARLARRIEFGDMADVGEAQEMVENALTLRPESALVASIASRVALDGTGDLDWAEHLANTALYCAEYNPYALQSKSRISLMRGRTEDAQQEALLARKVAAGMPHVFAWDFEIGLTALAQGDLIAAQAAFLAAHKANRAHRASLRYLLATSLLVGDVKQARKAEATLAEFEPGFQLSHLCSPDYPVLTLRNLGLVDDIRVP